MLDNDRERYSEMTSNRQNNYMHPILTRQLAQYALQHCACLPRNLVEFAGFFYCVHQVKIFIFYYRQGDDAAPTPLRGGEKRKIKVEKI